MADKQADSGRSAGSETMNSMMRRQLGKIVPGEQEETAAEATAPAPDPAQGDSAPKDMNALMRGMFGKSD